MPSTTGDGDGEMAAEEEGGDGDAVDHGDDEEVRRGAAACQRDVMSRGDDGLDLEDAPEIMPENRWWPGALAVGVGGEMTTVRGVEEAGATIGAVSGHELAVQGEVDLQWFPGHPPIPQVPPGAVSTTTPTTTAGVLPVGLARRT